MAESSYFFGSTLMLCSFAPWLKLNVALYEIITEVLDEFLNTLLWHKQNIFYTSSAIETKSFSIF